MSESRFHETSVAIDAPIEDVWKALTEAPDLARWFAPNITVDPGPGGSITVGWGPGLEGKTVIEVWEPRRHLRLVESREGVRLVQDYYLEAAAGKTVLRLVHSGFGSSEDWDQEYEGTRGGWPICFFRLQQGLEHHRHHSVYNVLLPSQCPGVDPREALQRIEAAAPRNMQIALHTTSEFCGLLPDHNHSILSVSTQPSPTGSVAYLELLLFGLSPAESLAVENEWKAKLQQQFPEK